MISEKKPLIIIGGATAVGKTKVSVMLAKKINGEIVSADSMQIYKGMDIGTAKIRQEETEGIPHYMIDIADPEDDFSVYDYKNRAQKYINDIHKRGKIPLLVGGTGFYIQSVLYDIDFNEEGEDKGFRESLKPLSNEDLHAMLERSDPDSAAAIHPNNRKRVIRALEYYHSHNEPISAHNRTESQKTSPYAYAYFVLNRKREEIYGRIEERVDKMFEEGLIEEVKNLLDKGVSDDAVSMQAIGYKETAAYLKGKISLEEAISQIKLNTRHYAKRQITWFKREKGAVWLDYGGFSDEEEIVLKILEILKEKKIV